MCREACSEEGTPEKGTQKGLVTDTIMASCP